MKHILCIVMILASALLGGQNWQVINNVTHVHDIEKSGDTIYFSSWGGVVKIQGDDALPFSEMQQVQQISTGDGLVSNDIRNLALIDVTQSLWMGSGYDGISILNAAGMQALGSDLGLPSSRVYKIIESENYILVATALGLAVYYYLPGVNFPLILEQYDSFTTSGALPNNNITDMLLNSNRQLFLAHDSGVSYVHLDSLAINSAWHSLSSGSSGSGNFLPIDRGYKLSANDTKIAVASSKKVYYHDLDFTNPAWQSITTVFGNETKDISAVHIDSEDRLWIAYGLWNESLLNYSNVNDTLLTRVDLTDLVATHWMRDEASLGHNVITQIKELEGELYICTWGDGIAKYRQGNWEYFNPNSIAFPKITQSAADQNNALWFCSGIERNEVVRKGTLGVSSLKDGHWTSYQTHNSRLHSNNILTLAVDSRNRKWFGAWDSNYEASGNHYGLTIYDDADESWLWLTRRGVAEWDEETGDWGDWVPDSPRLLTSTIAGIHRDLHDNMLVLCYDGGVSVFDREDNLIGEFRVPDSVNQHLYCAYHNGRQYFFGTLRDVGLLIWNDDSIPVTGGEHWVTQIVPELRGGTVFGVASVETPYSGWQHFIASSTGLYMWDEQNWYKYGVYIKRQIYNFAASQWENETLYYVDEERLFGSIQTVPNAIYGDPFGKIWIGSLDNGMSMYDARRERFTNYYQGNSPLLSNQIISFGYDPLGGRLLIGSSEGLNTLSIGRTVKPETSLQQLKAYPNPFKPNGQNTVQIVNHPPDSMPIGKNHCHIYSASGDLVIKLKENNYSRFEWDGRNKAGKLVSSGIYYFVVTDQDGTAKRGKIAVLR
ncbi:MAG: T9SS type A sorting domain-containing protein [Candidatus Cloacimonetes bacterium]|nr:T9SS type A sorting domain-containing protein [Candidatus Cloacimonadota bacterium]